MKSLVTGVAGFNHVRHTEAEIARARDRLGYSPRVALKDGLAQEWDWIRKISGY